MSAVLDSPATFRGLIESCVGMENPFHFLDFTIEISGRELDVLPTIASFSRGSLQSSSLLLGAFFTAHQNLESRMEKVAGPSELSRQLFT